MEFIKNDIENNKKSKEVKVKSSNKKRIFNGIFLGLLCGICIFVAGEIFIGGGIKGKNMNAEVSKYCVVTNLKKNKYSSRTLDYSINCTAGVTITDTQYKTDSVDWTSRGNGPGSYTSKTGSIVFRSSLVGKNIYLRVKYKINGTPTIIYSDAASVVLGNSKTFNQTPSPYLTIAYDSRATMSNGIGTVKSYNAFAVNYTFNTKKNYYYRWVTYKSDNRNDIAYNGTCLVGYNNKKYNPTLTTSEVYPNRLGNLRIYASESECKSDTKGTSEKFLSESPVIYRYRGSVPNSSGLSVNEITELIGGSRHYCNMTNNTYNDCASAGITNKFVCIAYSQVGYVEKQSDDKRDYCFENKGTGDRQKYGNNGGAWCAAFVDWVGKKAGINFSSLGVGLTASTGAYEDWAIKEKRWNKWDNTNSPTNIHEGDILIFNGHIGIAYKRNGILWLIDGNNSSRVEDHSYEQYKKDEGSSKVAVPEGYISLNGIAYEK